MDLRQIKNIIKEFEDSTINKLEISDKEFSIRLEKNNNSAFSSISSAPVSSVAAQAAPVVQESVAVADSTPQYIPVKAPLVGTFYESPSPDASPFVRVNQQVQEGDTLFIVEAMKVMNEITAPVSGTIVKINVSDATMVEYGQVVMEIKE
ncbi:MAG: acetyl-CoA carboxylase biotin carboxyl carrier protein [Halieaceae bacterium]|jgi:acetyl-CoA carboxylase biotin carboxyl carrier protein|nr:acetyl-CoA carboxylase biotin carboxyl carrier protein [Halieaceae bacterium]